MALVVETGTGSASSESYVSVTQADQYHSDRMMTLWATMSTAEKEAALRRTTDYLTTAYRLRWAGGRKTTTQALDWPRSYVPVKDAPEYFGGSSAFYSDSVVPPELMAASCALALRAAAGQLIEDQERAVTSVTVGPISQTYDKSSSQSKRYPEIDAMLRPLLKGNTSQVTMVRV